jgi:hypothetical protein
LPISCFNARSSASVPASSAVRLNTATLTVRPVSVARGGDLSDLLSGRVPGVAQRDDKDNTRRLHDGFGSKRPRVTRPVMEPALEHDWRITATAANFPEAVRETEEVVPVNVSTWVLPCGVTVGR